MQKFNLHTHTFRCGHASGTDDQMVLSAIEAGFELLGFSDHMPYPELHLPTCRMFYDQRQEYVDSIPGRVKALIRVLFLIFLLVKTGQTIIYFSPCALSVKGMGG